MLWLVPHYACGLNMNGLPLVPAVLVLFGAVARHHLGNPAKVEWTARSGAG